jgi:endoglucanase
VKIRFQQGIAPILIGKTSILILSTFVIGQMGLLGIQIQYQKTLEDNPRVAQEIQGNGQNLQPVIIPPTREEIIDREESVKTTLEQDEDVAIDDSSRPINNEGLEQVSNEVSSETGSSEQTINTSPQVGDEQSVSDAPEQQTPSPQENSTQIESPTPSQDLYQQPSQSVPLVTETPTSPPSESTFSKIAGKSLHVESWSFAGDTANAIRSSDPAAAMLLDGIAAVPQARWFGEWVSNVSAGVGAYVQEAKSANAVPMIVLYNIPYRDCHGYSGGGLADRTAYLEWITAAQQGIGNNPAVVILEPDAIALVECLPQAKRTERYQMIAEAVNILNRGNQTLVYIDAGHSNWVSTSVMASRLQQSGVGSARGFALNVSNFRTSEENQAYGESLSNILGGKGYVIDTSRNGRGPDPNAEWCNPAGRGLGEKPRFVQDSTSLDAFLWIKKPGESDGTCNGGPSAGRWWSEYAIGLAERAKEPF